MTTASAQAMAIPTGRGRPWGVVADDVTGACDVAAELTELGLSVAVHLGVPEADSVPTDLDVVVIGLTTRTADRTVAVDETLAAVRALMAAGDMRIYQKYCSTFDSTDDGMIGPVAEAIAVELGATGTIGTPATPAAGRTVYRGHLFVGDRLVSESSLARHPLTPMTDPDLVRVLARQSTWSVRSLDRESLHSSAVAELLTSIEEHTLVDAIDEQDLDALARAIDERAESESVLAGGGAGLITALGRRLAEGGARGSRPVAPVETGASMILAGSASDRTRAQLAAAGSVLIELDARRSVTDPDDEFERILARVEGSISLGERPIVSAAHDAAAVARAQVDFGVEVAAKAVEAQLARIARASVEHHGVRLLIVAGGESSGAVTSALGLRALRVTTRVDQGTAWAVGAATTVEGEPRLGVLLKSGNFGGLDLLTRAWESAP